MIEGCLSVWVSGEWVEVPAGTAVFLPRGAEHTFVAATEKARVLSFFAPAGFERFYGEMAATGPLDVERMVTIAARYGCEITGPTPKRSGVVRASLPRNGRSL